MTSLHNAKYHILAILTVAVWGTTFISTKVLINNGLTPHEIFFIRFVIAYIGIWFISPRRIFSENVKDELTLGCRTDRWYTVFYHGKYSIAVYSDH